MIKGYCKVFIDNQYYQHRLFDDEPRLKKKGGDFDLVIERVQILNELGLVSFEGDGFRLLFPQGFDTVDNKKVSFKEIIRND